MTEGCELLNTVVNDHHGLFSRVPICRMIVRRKKQVYDMLPFNWIFDILFDI